MSENTNRPLPVLRAMVDQLDREILELLARRQAVAAEIAATKRTEGKSIRDLGREQAVLDARKAQAEQLHLPPNVVESIWRLLMLASRDHQASLRPEAPKAKDPKNVAIIGANGGMGRVLMRLFADLGHYVLPVDVDTELTLEEAAKGADVVIVSVPIRETERVIRAVGPLLGPSALLMDVTSLKDEPVRVMLESTEASVIGTHPMFGPGVHTLQGQRVVVCPGRGAEWLTWVTEAFETRGLVVTLATPAVHDRAMSLVQVLTHFQTQVLGLTLSRMGMPLEEPLAFTSPAYLLELYVTARHFAQSPALYGPIEMENPETARVTETFMAAAREISGILETRDQTRFDALFREVGAFFGEFTEEALEQSGFLIDRLVELSTGRSTEIKERAK
jgi:chorismate mutase/prephenate dehydrogenase